MNLHLTHDNVFIDYIINSATTLQLSDNKYVVYTETNNPPEFVKSKTVEYAQYDSPEFRNIIGDIKQYKTVYIHWLYGNTVDFVNKLPESVKVVWCFWGGDGLELSGMIKYIYQPKTYSYFKSTKQFKWLPVSFSQYRYQLYIFNRNLKHDRDHLKAIKRVNYFAHYLKEDYELIKKYTHFTAEFIPFHYAALEKIVPVDQLTRPDGDNFILGNSDSLPNNHFEAIDLLASVELGTKNIYCPLSYEKGQYALDVADYGKKMLGNNFIPLQEFLPKHEYDRMLGSVSFAIMNHNRSQALGNILVLLWNGAKLFMSKDSTLFHYFSDNNVLVYNFQMNFSENGNTIFTKLKEDEVQKNRVLLTDLFGEKNHLMKMRTLLSI